MSRLCALCEKKIRLSDPGLWKEVKGFVGGRKKDSMTLRRDTGRYAHDTCVKAAQDGQEPNQVSLLDAPKPAKSFMGIEFDELNSEMFLE